MAMIATLDLSKYREVVREMVPVRYQGQVTQVVGLSIEVEGLDLRIGEICHIYSGEGAPRVSAEVMGFKNGRIILMPFADVQGIRPNAATLPGGRLFTVPVGPELLGRVIDGLGRPIDDKGALGCTKQYPLTNAPPHPLNRAQLTSPLETGVKAIDAVLTCGKGQRVGIFSGSGVGKSTLLGMIACHAASDVNVIALIGERGREVREFIEHNLGPKGLSRSVIVVSTSDQPALLRIKGAWVATTIAEYFRDCGMDVVFMMDSVTRFAMAQREIGLAVGEPPATKGYTPSVFALLPKLMERTGTSDKGTITGFYTVLVEADDMNEPISDTVRSILDGHINLSRELASENHYPSIDILNSVSRVMSRVVDGEHLQAAGRLRELVSAYRNARDLINIGAYVSGSNHDIDEALLLMPVINNILCQSPDDAAPFSDTAGHLKALFAGKETAHA
ncbi:MAG: FliI/YscN family ATPase [Chloroflexi bacterium]|nr:FliI/YscN family ATPase [Chloroflexota bacterium]